MAKTLTAAAVARLKPDKNHRREIPDAGCKGLYLVIEPSGSRSWGYRYRRPGSGTSANLRLGRVDLSGQEPEEAPKIGDPLSLAAARTLAAEAERQRLRGRDPAQERQLEKQQARIVHAERESNLFPAAVRQFADEYVVARKGRRPRNWRWRARALGLLYPEDAGEPVMVPHGLCERWRDRPVTEITANDIYAVVDEARRHCLPGMGKLTAGLSDERARKMRDALGALFGFLLEHRKIVSNPCLGVWRPPPPAPRQRILNCKPDVRGADELRFFWSACDTIGQPFGAALRLLLLTGQRLREVAEMEWRELSDDFSLLHLSGERTKNGREHEVPLPPMAREIIRSVQKIEGCEFVFSTNGRTPTGSWNRIKAKLDEAMTAEAKKEHGNGVEPWVIHDLRRTAATGMADIGILPHVIEACLNHTSGAKAGVAGVYNVAAYDKEKADALIRWSEQIERIVTGQTAKVVPIKRGG
jgi:integrase